MRFRNTAVAVASLFFSLAFAHAASAATMYVVVDKSTVQIGDRIVATVKIDSEDQGINAAQGTLQFSKDILEAVSIDKSSSVFGFWLEEPSYSNDSGQVSFVGGTTAGLTGTSLSVLRVTFKVKGSGKASIVFSDGALAASDGSGTNVLSALRGVAITSSPSSGVTPPVPGSPVPAAPTATTTPAETVPPKQTGPVVETKPVQIVRPAVVVKKLPTTPKISVMLFPDPQKWYNLSDTFFATWDLPADITDVADEINKKVRFDPTASEGLFDNRSYNILEDGIWFLHVRFKNNVGWGSTASYRLALDRTPPLPFDVTIREGLLTDVPTPTISYATGDELSGIGSYTIRVDTNELITATSTSYVLSPLKPGKHQVTVLAHDQAGNVTESSLAFEILPIAAPTITAVSRPIYIGEGKLTLAGTALPDAVVHLTLKKKSGDFVAEIAPHADANGNWEGRFDQPLTLGKYEVAVIAEDARGAQSLPVSSGEIRVLERPLFVMGGIEVTKNVFFINIVLALLAAFAAGFFSYRLWRKQMGFRVTLAARDVVTAFNAVRKDLDKCLANYADKSIDLREAQEMEYVLRHMRAGLDNMQKYIVENIEEIRD